VGKFDVIAEGLGGVECGPVSTKLPVGEIAAEPSPLALETDLPAAVCFTILAANYDAGDVSAGVLPSHGLRCPVRRNASISNLLKTLILTILGRAG
jgi:hypothetical protein